MRRAGSYKPRQPGSLKQAQDALVKACGGEEKAATLTRVRSSQIRRYTDEGAPESNMPADVVMALELHCGEPYVTRFLAMSAGGVFVRLPRDHSRATCMKHMASIGRDTGKLYSETCTALADGSLTQPERVRVRAHAMETMTALAGLVGDLADGETHGR